MEKIWVGQNVPCWKLLCYMKPFQESRASGKEHHAFRTHFCDTSKELFAESVMYIASSTLKTFLLKWGLVLWITLRRVSKIRPFCWSRRQSCSWKKVENMGEWKPQGALLGWQCPTAALWFPSSLERSNMEVQSTTGLFGRDKVSRNLSPAVI